jgi:predicted Ser/Thr protein kinase
MTLRPDPRLGTTLGPYRIEAVLGRGGMGVVYLAEQVRLGRKVALKILPPELAEDEVFRARFVRESQMAAAIDDPNILPIYEAGEADGAFFLAMRYVEGTDLEKRLAAGPLEPREAVRLLGQVASALDAAHARGLVHRDVKPANILIAPAPGDERGDHVYLADFGLTKYREEATALTRAGTLLGTLDYMAPEQMEGRQLDGTTDQYALAAIAFRALTGRLPFVRDNEVALITAHLKDPPPSASGIRVDLPPAVDPVLARAMAKDPAVRYPTCSAFVAALREAVGGPATGAYDIQPRPGRASRRAALLVGVLALLSVGLGGVLLRGAAPNPSASPSGAGASATPDPSAYPNGDEATLLGKLPQDIARSCTRGSYELVKSDAGGAQARPLANVRCTIGSSGAKRVEALQLRESSVVTADSVVAQAAAEHAAPSGDCGVDAPALGTWSIASTEIGAVACFNDGNDAVIEWAYQNQDLLLIVYRSNQDEKALLDWWLTERDLIGTAGLPSASEEPYPNAAEAALLAELPAALATACGRGSYALLVTDQNGLSIRPIASISCTQPTGSGPNLLELRAITPSADITVGAVIAATARSYGSPPGDCASTGRAQGRWSIADRDVGAIVCYRDAQPHAIIDWTYDANQILARVRAPDADESALYAWWAANARFIAP